MLAGYDTSFGNLERARPGTLNLVERQRPSRGDLLAVPGDLAARQLPASPSTALIFEGWSRWPLVPPSKIKVSGRLSGKTVLARAYLELVSACARSCSSRSARSTCGDGT
jgi:hypothetical protein